jgi:hypothetical protein
MNKKYLFKKIKSVFLIVTLAAMIFASMSVGVVGAVGPTIFINEIHYDNTGTDTGEAIEIAGPASTNLNGWSLVLYNGANSKVYHTKALSGIIPNQQGGFGTLYYAINPIQNGAPDGIALVDNTDTVIQFLSYEGSFTANDGPANGMTSTNIGVSESGSTLAGHSLQLTGTGTTYDDFTWSSPAANTFGSLNTGQTFETGEEIPEFPTLALPIMAVIGLMFLYQRRRGK